MKKFIPLILLGVGIIAAFTAFLLIRGKSKDEEKEVKEETVLLNIPISERPVVSLTPTSDGHYLKMKIEKIEFDPKSMDYELVYQVPGGVPQGVPGSVDVEGKNEFEAELLLGSESSGKFRYDEGVEEGTLTFRFRNEEGQLLAKFGTDFRLKTGTKTLISPDEVIKIELEESSDEYFVLMNTIGVPDGFSGSIGHGPYGIFSSSEEVLPGIVEADFTGISYWNGESWQDAEDQKASNIGIFIGIASE